MTRVPEMMAQGITVALGHDCVMDPWYALGSADMLDVAHMAVHVGQMTGLDAMGRCFEAVTANAAPVLELDGYGLAPGCWADMVLLQAADPVEAIRVKPPRLAVIRRGRVIARTPPRVTALDLPGRPGTVRPHPHDVGDSAAIGSRLRVPVVHRRFIGLLASAPPDPTVSVRQRQQTEGDAMAVRYGAAACGHTATAAAAGEVLEDGGNAVDAALAALCTACIAEPVLASLGGGGFALVVPAGGVPLLYDFFPETPSRRRPDDEIDFRAIEADFGTTRQTFHIGLGAAATPGLVRGLFALHRDHGRRPLTRIVEPAVRLASDGIAVTDMAASLFQVVAPILLASPGARQIFAGAPDGAALLRVGDRLRWPGLADVLDTLAREGERLFYEGEIARSIDHACAQGGGHLTLADMAAYRVERRPPLVHRYRGLDGVDQPAARCRRCARGLCADSLAAEPPMAQGSARESTS